MPAPKFNAELRTALQKIKLANERLMSPMENCTSDSKCELKSILLKRTGDNSNVFNKLKS